MQRPLTKNIRPGQAPLDLAAYERAGGYATVHDTIGLADRRSLVREVEKSGLGGCGGGGFPTGRKWQAMPPRAERPGPRYFIVNADEMEPGTFKDRYLMEGDPHQLIEGIILSAYAVQANIGYIFIRGEYTRAIALLTTAIAQAEHAGLAPDINDSADLLYACGPGMKFLYDAVRPEKRGAHAANSAALAPIVAGGLRAGDAVLVKGSLGSRMRLIVETLEQAAG